MKIQFCDLCNESVPEADFAGGKARMLQGRVICTICESAMSGSGGVGVVSPDTGKRAANQTLSAKPSVAVAPPPATADSSNANWIGLLALIMAGSSAWFFSGEINTMRQEDGHYREALDGELEAVGDDLDQISLRARDRDEQLEIRLRSNFNQRQSEAETELAGLREELSGARTQLRKIDGELARLATEQRDGEVGSGQRHDQLLAQVLKSRNQLDGFSTRLADQETALAARNTPARVELPVVSKGPNYEAELADLSSETAGTRWNAVQSLGETKDPQVVPFLLPLLKDSDVFVRMAVARVCGDLSSPMAIESLIDALEDQEPVVREAAMAALHIITGRDHNFDPNAKPGERSKRVRAWRDWWKKASSEFLGDI
ncbi:MAG: hypothetical protein ACI8X5_000420 [Planctomycetota bacterium]|jgi:hypothetical protein